MLPVDQVDPATDNPRGTQIGNVDGLAASIGQVGVLQPVTVTPRDGRYLLVYGHRRLAAAKQAGRATIPAIVQARTEAERVTRQTVENLHREDLSPLQEATAIANLRDTVAAERNGRAPSQRELAERLGLSQSHISKRLELLELPAEVQAVLDSGGITLGQAQDLHRLVKANRTKQAVALAKLHADRNRQQAAGGYVYGPTLKQQVDDEVKEAQAQAREAEARAELKAAGVRVLKEPHGGWWKAAAAMLTQPHEHCLFFANHLDVPVDDHAAAHPDGHAAAVCRRHGQAQWVCTDPKAHADTHPQAADVAADHERTSAKEEARRDQERHLAVAAKARQAFVTELLATPVKVPAAARDLLAGITAVAIERLESDAAKLVCALLGLEPVIEPPSLHGGGRRKNYREALHRRAPEDLGRVAQAVTLGQGEFRARWTYGSWRNPMVLSYLERLIAAGYQPSPVEVQRLAEARAPQQPGSKQEPPTVCACGEESDEHEGGVGACRADGCGCQGFRPEEWTDDQPAAREPEEPQ